MTAPNPPDPTPPAEYVAHTAGPGTIQIAEVYGYGQAVPGACPYCSGPHSSVFHGGFCPRIKTIEYHPNGGVKRVEFHALIDGADNA